MNEPVVGTVPQSMSVAIFFILFQLILWWLPFSFFLRWQGDRETKRRLDHCALGPAIAVVMPYIPKVWGQLLLLLATIVIEYMHVYHFTVSMQQHELTDSKMRYDTTYTCTKISYNTDSNNVTKQLPGMLYFLLGISVTKTIIPNQSYVQYAINCLSFCDPMAAWVVQTLPYGIRFNMIR